ncbi:unnamed protein product [Choristocarpus tenellus]
MQYYKQNTTKFLIDHEVFTDYVLNKIYSRPALIYVEGFEADFGVNVAELHSSITERYEVPMVSYRHAVYPNRSDPTDAIRLWGNGGGPSKGTPHPGWETHQLFADVLIHYLQVEYVNFCSKFGGATHRVPFLDGVTERAEQTCLQGHLTYMGVTGGSPFKPVFGSDGTGDNSNQEKNAWKLGEDVPGKPGLLVYGNNSPGASISFDMTCRTGSSVSVGYLGSYVGMGVVEVLVNGTSPNHDGSQYLIDGLWDEHISVESYTFIPLHGGGVSGSTVNSVTRADGKHIDRPEYELAKKAGAINTRKVRGSAKFKLLSLACC